MPPAEKARPRFRFGEFVLSPSRRSLTRSGREVALIPRYFDLLVLLVERRNQAVHRQWILDQVWNDVVVSDGALSQAVRILRRTLGDDPREPRFVRTLPRHGYRFVFPEVIEESDDGPIPAGEPTGPGSEASESNDDPVERAIDTLLRAVRTGGHESERREAAEELHLRGTAVALARIGRRKGHETARAWLRDTRWDVPGAGEVPLVGAPGGLRAGRILLGLRLRRAVRPAERRWASAVAGAATSGAVAGFLGGLALRFGPGSLADNRVLVALSLVGAVIGAVAAVGVGAGLAGAEASLRSWRRPALVALGALGGGAVGAAAHLLGMLVLGGLFGEDLSPLAGGFEGVVLGGAVGAGYALATPTLEGGMATPRGGSRLLAVASAGLLAAIAAALLARSGSYLGAMSLDFMARGLPDAQVRLDPLARLLGEAAPGMRTRVAISAFEGLMFGAGLVFGLTRRPR